MSAAKPFICMFKTFLLHVKPTDDPKRFLVRISKRLSAHPFQQTLLIPPGTILEMRTDVKRNPLTRFLFVRAFKPRMRYNGRSVTSGEIIAD